MEKSIKKNEYQIIDVKLYKPDSSACGGLKLVKEIGKDPISKIALAVMADDAGKFLPALRKKYEAKLPKKKGGVPQHAKLARQLGIAEREPVADAGALRWLPKGAAMVEKVRRRFWDVFINESEKYGPCKAYPIISPVVIAKRDPGVKWLIGNFPEKKYWVSGDAKPGKSQELFLRISSDYSAFSLHRDRLPSYKELPYGFLEFENDFRYEQSGELRGLHRVRELHMQNFHSISKNKNEAIQVMLQNFNQFYSVCKECNAEPDILVAYALKDEWVKMEKQWINLAKKIKKPLLVMFIDKLNLYMCAWIDMVVIDSLGRPMEIGSSQLDVSSAKQFRIEYVNNKGQRVRPVIVHAGVGIERLFAGMLERALREREVSLPKLLEKA